MCTGTFVVIKFQCDFDLHILFYRDTYDKEVKAKLTEKPKQRQNKQKKPDIHVYVPPTKLKGNRCLLWIIFTNGIHIL